MSDSIRLSTVFHTTPRRLYKAWLSSKEHGAMTGGEEARITARVGARFMAGGDYIQGRNLALDPYRCIVQSWRTTDFPEDAPHSRLAVCFDAVPGGTRLTLIHTEIPKGQGVEYRSGWKEFYFAPMRSYFASKHLTPRGTR